MKVSDAELIEWNRQGLIPGPSETEDEYLLRVRNCLNLKETLELDPSFLNNVTHDILDGSLKESKKKFGIEPEWIPLVFGNKHLAPWHGGCAWIFQMQENGPLGAFIQLRRAFLNSATYLGLYSREEIITHELSHVGRMAYQEPGFEEVLAYRASPRRFTRFFGPIIQSSTESVIFLLALALALAIEGYSIYYGEGAHLGILLGLLALPLAMIIYGCWRLWLKHLQFGRCLKMLELAVNDRQKADSIIYRLTDKEIRELGKMKPEEIESFKRQESSSSLRWRIIDAAYFHDNRK